MKNIIPLLILFFFCSNLGIAQEELPKLPESMPVFGDCKQSQSDKRTACSNQNLIAFISENLEYPELAKLENIEGTVVVSFTIAKDGAVVGPKVIRDIGGGCGEEAIRLLKLMPRWKPGISKNGPTDVNFKLPISFALNSEGPKTDHTYRILWGTISNLESITKEELYSNLISEVSVLDKNGNRIAMNELLFSITKNKRYWDASSTGSINNEMKRLVEKVKPKRIFSVVATIQVDGKFIFVEKDWEVVKQ